MEATDTEITPRETSKNYTSRPGALIWSFRKSRDRWKCKHQKLKASVKQLQNRVADVTKSREQWRLKAAEAATRLTALEAEITSLRVASGSPVEGKKNPRTLLR
jgi:uncharacterized protein YlxW (UPF0749 family)